MGIKYLLDTNAIGFIFSQKKSALNNKLKGDIQLFVSVISILEFLSNSSITENDKLLFESFIQDVTILDISANDKLLINQTIKLRKKYKLKLPDALIASQAIIHNLVLITGDKDFEPIHNLKLEMIT